MTIETSTSNLRSFGHKLTRGKYFSYTLPRFRPSGVSALLHGQNESANLISYNAQEIH